MRFPLGLSLLLLMLPACPAAAQGDALSEIRALAADRQYETALRRLEELLAETPKNVEARLLVGVVLTRQGKTGEAIETFQRLASEHPGLPEVHNNLAVLYAAESRFDDARKALLQAIALQPRYAIAHENLGDIYASLASLAYRRAYDLDRNNAGARDKSELLARAFRERAEASGEGSPGRVDATVAPRAPAAPAAKPGNEQALCFSTATHSSEAALAPALAWLGQSGASARVESRDEKQLLNYKVFLPPLESRDRALAQVATMRRAGIRDLLPIARGDLKHGIMLGVFSSEKAVRRRVAELRARGYAARSEPRYRHERVYWIEVRADARNAIDEAAFNRKFARLHLRRVPCG